MQLRYKQYLQSHSIDAQNTDLTEICDTSILRKGKRKDVWGQVMK